MGAYPAVGLASAREKAIQARVWLSETSKRDPRTELGRLAQQVANQGLTTLGAFAHYYLASIEGGFRKLKHRHQWRNKLKTYAAPNWTLPLDAITTDHVMECLSPIWATKPETARRLRGRIERVLDAATVRKLRAGDNPARWGGHLKTVFPNKRPKAQHFRAMDYAAVPAFMRCLKALESVSALCLRIAILTGLRSGEVRKATWDEVDMANALWTQPENRTKTVIERRVPLSDNTMEILHRMSKAQSHSAITRQ